MKYTKLNYFASQSSHTHFVYLAQGAAETVYLQFWFRYSRERARQTF